VPCKDFESIVIIFGGHDDPRENNSEHIKKNYGFFRMPLSLQIQEASNLVLF